VEELVPLAMMMMRLKKVVVMVMVKEMGSS
jgi:hypothetical protein